MKKPRKVKKLSFKKIVDIDRKRVFIENDPICPWYEDEREEFEDDVNMKFNDFFTLFIGDASSNKTEVLNAIKEYDDIYVDTSYVGNSSRLFNEMMSICLKLNIKGKRIFNFRPTKYLHMYDIDIDLYTKVAKDNLFYYRDEYSLNKRFLLSKRCYR